MRAQEKIYVFFTVLGTVLASPLFCAGLSESSVATFLLPSSSSIQNPVNQQKLTIQLIAALSSRKPLAFIKDLIQAGAQVDGCDQEGNTPLSMACRRTSEEVVRYLFSCGATITRAQGCTLMSCTSDETITTLLLERGEDPNARSHGLTELMIATKNMHEYGKIKLLLRSGAKINECAQQPDIYLKNPLHALVLAAHAVLTRRYHHATTTRGRQSDLYLRKSERLERKVQEIIPLVYLLLCNGADITKYTLTCLEEWLARIEEDARTLQLINPRLAHELSRVAQKISELQKILHDVGNDAEESIIKRIVKARSLLPAKPLVIDPKDDSKKVGSNVFAQVMARQAGRSHIPRWYSNERDSLASCTATPIKSVWPQREQVALDESKISLTQEVATQENGITDALDEPTFTVGGSEGKETKT